MKQNRSVLSLLFIAMAMMMPVSMLAQEKYLDVTSFRTLTTDMDARIQAPVEDQNGEKCALIKVSSNVKGLEFESPAMGIVKQEVVKGEIWVYIPEGSRSVTIKHNDFPPFRGYQYPVKIESAMVYEMKVTGHREGEAAGASSNSQMLTMNVQPTTASLFIDDEEMPVENGLFTAMMPKGTHTYRIEAKEYEPTSGTIDLGDQQWVRSIRLKEKFGYLSVTSYPEDSANVYIDDKLVGVTPFRSSNLEPQPYKVRIEKALYFPKDTAVMVNTGGETTDLVVRMVSTIKPKEGRKTFVLADVALGGGGHTSYGVMVGMAATSGAYIHGRTDFQSVSTSKECDDTGALADGSGIPYYTNTTPKKARLSITGGYIHRLTLNNPLKYGGMGGIYAFAGLGYGYRTLAWETAPDNMNNTTEWVKNTDHSASGIAAELGGICRMGSLAVSLSYSTVSFKYHEAALGVGLFF